MKRPRVTHYMPHLMEQTVSHRWLPMTDRPACEAPQRPPFVKKEGALARQSSHRIGGKLTGCGRLNRELPDLPSIRSAIALLVTAPPKTQRLPKEIVSSV